ncbi:MAG: Gldg family protein [Marinifilaceae bacterium]|jgi:gliding-associated putative ABC transporter substrate-binding component GldG|nr:Gldg family protein [Marinifilaceae bacterium]
MFSKFKIKKRKTSISTLSLVFILVVSLNIISSIFFYRIDLTADKRYTLDKATKKILKEVKKPIIITLYISENLPANLNNHVADLRSLLHEYSEYSNKNIDFQYIDPSTNPELEKEALKAGITPISIELRKKDELKYQKIFLGMVIQVGNKSDLIPYIEPGVGLEYNISTIIKRLTITDKPKIGYIKGHGEPELSSINQAMKELSVLYDIKPIRLLSTDNLNQFKSLLIISPGGSFSKLQLDAIDDYLAKGGNILIAIDRVNALLNEGIGVGVNTGLEKWLENKGLYVENSFVVDKSCSTVTVQPNGSSYLSQQIVFPYLPIITNFNKHQITDGIESVVMQFASPIYYINKIGLKYKPLAFTSNISGKQKTPISFDISKIWRNTDFLYPELTVAAALEGQMGGEKKSKICVFGDGSFLVNGRGHNKIEIQADNINLLSNAVDWLSDDSDIVSLRTKGILSRPLKEISESKKAFIKYINFLAPVLIIFLVGFLRFERRKIRRGRLMKPGHIE